ncbi:MAG: thioesterase [Crocinitomicaceae bacterium]|nr:thioesterase [Crocinitomicaceae bacterium]|tara:strand:+ start:1450 stop:1962 length:513 start_codon:yes stop_codon:yes gene_type:complete
MSENQHFNQVHINELTKSFNNTWKFRLSLLKILPMGFLSGMRIKKLDENSCHVQVPYKWLNKNPFKSIFWAVLGMAAEMSSGALVLLYTYKQKPSIAMLVSKCDANFVKKASDTTTFICNDGQLIKEAVIKSLSSKEGVEFKTSMTGYNSSNEEVAHFSFTWSIKQRSIK